MRKAITKEQTNKAKVYIAIGEDEIANVKKALGGKEIRKFRNPLELEIYNMAENNAEKTIYETTRFMTEEEKIEYFRELAKEYLIKKSLKED